MKNNKSMIFLFLFNNIKCKYIMKRSNCNIQQWIAVDKSVYSKIYNITVGYYIWW